MRVRLVRRPGQHGTRAYVEQYGDRLVCVRYRYDEAARRRYKTIELIVEEKEWKPRRKSEERAPEPPSQAALQRTAEARPQPARRSGPVGAPRWKSDTLVGLNISPEEANPAQRLRSSGAIWVEHLAVWQVTYAQAVALGLTDRIVGTIGDIAAAKVRRDARH
jgi:hypothetical protein